MSLQAETFEALCSALYRLPFAELLGEQDRPGPDGEERVAFFHIGEHPKDIRVSVIYPKRGKDEIRLFVEWRNYAADARNPLKGEQTLAVSTYAAVASDLGPATEAAILKVLSIYTDVLEESGVAGMIEVLAPAAEESEE